MHIVQRAFEIADSDRACLKVSDILQALFQEGYGTGGRVHFEGNAIRTQLRTRIEKRIAAEKAASTV